jgi:hypothetical protein
VPTRRGLAALELPLPEPLDGVGAGGAGDGRDQARDPGPRRGRGPDDVRAAAAGRLRDGTIEPNRGLTSLPRAAAGRSLLRHRRRPVRAGRRRRLPVRDPGAGSDRPDGEPTFHAFWAVDENGQVTPEAEKRAFEQTIDLMMDRLASDPEIHIYHYAPTSHGGRPADGPPRHPREEVDRLLRGEVFVDLFRAVRQGLRASVESYSIKKLEPLYGLTREEGLRDAGSSIVAFESWLAEAGTGSGSAPAIAATDETLRSIEPTTATTASPTGGSATGWRSGGWSWRQGRRAAAAAGTGRARGGRGLSERLAHVAEVADRLCAGFPRRQRIERRPSTRRWLLAQLLSWHRREEKSFWWRFFHLMNDLTDEERVAEREPIGGLSLSSGLGPSGALHGVPLPLPRAGARHRRRDSRCATRPPAVAGERRGAGRSGGHDGSAPRAKTDGPHPRRSCRAATWTPRRSGQLAADRRVGRGTASTGRASTRPPGSC